MKRADSFYEKERILIEIQHMKQLLDILEKNVKAGLDFQDTTGLKENIKNWNRDVGKLKKMITALELAIETLAEENPACRAGSIPVCSVISEEESVQPDSDRYGKEEFREQISAFVESMTECIDDFVDRICAYESEEELYEDAEIEYPEPCDYGSEEYDYPTKAKAKTACKEAVETMVRDVQEMYREERDHITSYASEYFSGLEEAFCEFVNEFLESYDEYASLECENEAQEYVLSRKSELFGKREIQKETEQVNLKERFAALENEIFDMPAKDFFVVKEYFAQCTYDEEEGAYCFDIESACGKIHDLVNPSLKKAEKSFPEYVRNAYIDSMMGFCKALKDRLAKL